MRSQTAAQIAAAGVMVLLLYGCSPRVILVRGGPTPAWVDHLPRRAGKLCALGYSGPTYYQQDCAKNASENARGNLANSISVTIRSVTIDISDGTRGYFSTDVFVEGSESVSAAVLQGSEIQAQWVDMQGQRGTPNGCYTLVCIDSSRPIEKFVQKLQEKRVPAKTVEQVRADAQAAFEALEKAEEKAAPPAPVSPQPPPTEEPSQPDK